MAKKAYIEFEGFNEVIARLHALEGNVKEVTEDALKKTKRHVHERLETAMQKHNQTFKTINSLDEETGVEWLGSVASIDIGFHISKGGLPSIFLMYGTPRMKKDSKLYGAIYGKKVRDEIKKMQEDLFYDEIRRLDS